MRKTANDLSGDGQILLGLTAVFFAARLFSATDTDRAAHSDFRQRASNAAVLDAKAVIASVCEADNAKFP
jgi:hypothetical protein